MTGAAPVITHEATYGTPPPRFRAAERNAEVRAWLTIALAGMTALWLTAFALAQVTAREVAIPAAERGLAALSEVDSLLALGERTLCAQAGGEGIIDLPGFPVRGVEVRGSEVRCIDGRLDREALRALLLARGADLVYLRGIEAFIDAGRTPEAVSPFSGTGAVRGLIDGVTSAVHERVAMAACALGALGVVLTAVLLVMGRGFGRLSRIGIALSLGALPVLGTGLVLRFALGALAARAGDPMLDEFIAVARALTAVPLRDALWLLVGGLALVAPGVMGTRLRGGEGD
ncbi:MAG: hypothetical protein EXR68_05805 [Dehalococcoidia bacterium]|nr:hypothetical protein [Dehalococcoidia bacterium]